MNVHLLGTTGYHPNQRRHTSCVMIPEHGILLDAGTAVFRIRDLIETESLQIFLSHAHADHCIGLTYFLDVIHERDVKQMSVYGEQEKLSAIQTHLFSEFIFPVTPPFDWHSLKGDFIELPGSGKLTWIQLQHPGGSVGYRIDWPDRSLAYITDTTAEPGAKYIDFIHGVDLLIHECNFPDGNEELARETGHSCLTPVAEVSQAANVGMTVITHFNALDETGELLDLSSVASVFDKMFLAEDQMVVEL